MKLPGLILTLTLVLLELNFISTQNNTVNTNPYRHLVSLDPQGRYNLEWLVDWSTRRVTFNVTAATLGYIGFGLAHKDGKMRGADMIIGGVLPSGASYFADRYAVGNRLPEEDPTSQDWTLHSASENGTHTFLSFSRPFDTCDADYDLPITDDLSTLIWSFSEADDELQYHFQNRGVYDVYLLDPDLTPDLQTFDRLEQAGIPMNMSRFSMQAELQLPQVDTMYWCHFFRSPTSTKRHIIGFQTVFPTIQDEQHVHHLLVHRCRAPPGMNQEQLFEQATMSQGTECFFVGEPHSLPTEYCQEVIHLWGVGGRPIFFPDQAGMSMSANGTEYFMIQVHYDNPNIQSNNVTFAVDAFYTEDLQRNEVGMMPLGETTPAATSIVIPPNSLNHEIFGYCPSNCLERMLPAEGVTVFAGFLHTHLLGTGVRFLHWRGGQELPWISNADNYNFNYQQFRLLIEERRVLPGDQLGMRCTYDTTPRNGATVVGGHSTRDEMCTGHLYYYTNQPIRFSFCRSELRTERYMNFLGIRNTTWDPSRRQMMVTEPVESAGLTVYDFANQEIEWNLERREEIQRLQRQEPQGTQCPIVEDTPPDLQEWQGAEEVSWNLNERGVPRFERPQQCSQESMLGGGGGGRRQGGVGGNWTLRRLEGPSSSSSTTTTSTTTTTTTTTTSTVAPPPLVPTQWLLPWDGNNNQQQLPFPSRFWRDGRGFRGPSNFRRW